MSQPVGNKILIFLSCVSSSKWIMLKDNIGDNKNI